MLDYGKFQRRTVELTNLQLRQSTLRGFDLIKRGKRATIEALTQFNAQVAGVRGHQPAPQYGELQRLLRRKCGYHKDLQPMRKFMRDYVIDRYPMEKGFPIFGEPLAERRIHSIGSACRDAKIRRELVEEMLIERKAGHHGKDGLFALDQPLTVEIVEELKAEKRRYLSADEAAEFLGASQRLFKGLHKSGFLQARKGKGKWERKSFDAAFLKSLLQQLFLRNRVL